MLNGGFGCRSSDDGFRGSGCPSWRRDDGRRRLQGRCRHFQRCGPPKRFGRRSRHWDGRPAYLRISILGCHGPNRDSENNLGSCHRHWDRKGRSSLNERALGFTAIPITSDGFHQRLPTRHTVRDLGCCGGQRKGGLASGSASCRGPALCTLSATALDSICTGNGELKIGKRDRW